MILQVLETLAFICLLTFSLAMAQNSLLSRTLFVIVMHAQDSIRDVEMNNFNKMEALSGGYCGKIFVTDISHFKADKLIDNGKYDAGNAISSVSWNPGCDCVSDGVGCA